MLLDIFKEIYNLPQDSEFKRLELEEALVDKFGNLKYNKYDGWTNKSTGEVYPARYAVDLDTNYSIYSLYSYGTDYVADNIEEALMVFFIKYGKEPKEGTDEYYVEAYKKIFHEIVDEVYSKERISC